MRKMNTLRSKIGHLQGTLSEKNKEIDRLMEERRGLTFKLAAANTQLLELKDELKVRGEKDNA